jgi:hypothetical protein
VKTRIIKQLSGVLVAVLASAAVMQLLCAYLELKYTRETLAWELKCEANLLTMRNERTRRQAEKIAELETKLKALTAEKTPLTDNGPAAAGLF